MPAAGQEVCVGGTATVVTVGVTGGVLVAGAVLLSVGVVVGGSEPPVEQDANKNRRPMRMNV